MRASSLISRLGLCTVEFVTGADASKQRKMSLIQALLASLIFTLVKPLKVLPNRDALDLSKWKT